MINFVYGRIKKKLLWIQINTMSFVKNNYSYILKIIGQWKISKHVLKKVKVVIFLFHIYRFFI